MVSERSPPGRCSRGKGGDGGGSRQLILRALTSEGCRLGIPGAFLIERSGSASVVVVARSRANLSAPEAGRVIRALLAAGERRAALDPAARPRSWMTVASGPGGILITKSVPGLAARREDAGRGQTVTAATMSEERVGRNRGLSARLSGCSQRLKPRERIWVLADQQNQSRGLVVRLAASLLPSLKRAGVHA